MTRREYFMRHPETLYDFAERHCLKKPVAMDKECARKERNYITLYLCDNMWCRRCPASLCDDCEASMDEWLDEPFGGD